MPSPGFQFKQFYVAHDQCAHAVGTDGVLLAAWVNFQHPQNILDIGSGSGLISLMCAQRYPGAEIHGIEQDEPAYWQSLGNIAKSPFASRVHLFHGDFRMYPFRKTYEALISNPPFFKGVTSSGIEARDKARASLSLPHETLLERALELLAPAGKLALILPREEARLFIQLAGQAGIHLIRLCRVYGRPDAADKRWLMEFARHSGPLQESTLYLREDTGSFTTAYRALCQDFYL